YLLPTIRGERVDCLAMTEPNAGSDVRSMTTRAARDGDDWILNGAKHFISYADVADFGVPGRQGHARIHGQPRLVVGLASRLSPLRAVLRRLPDTRLSAARRAWQRAGPA